MRKLDPITLERIEALIGEQNIDLPPYALEKDFHVFEAIKAVSSLVDSSDFRLVFCGGTCLEKAHGSSGGCRRTWTSRSFRRSPARD
jgi:hypothetical protein